MQRLPRTTAVLVAALVAMPAAADAQTITNGEPPGAGGWAFGPIGTGGFGQLGQIFTVAADASLMEFSFWLFPSNETSAAFRGRVYEWMGGSLGTELFSSGPYDVPLQDGGGWVTSDGGGVFLTGGNSYVVLFDPAETPYESFSGMAVAGDTYSGGSIYSSWGGAADYADAYFRVELGPPNTVVPEPISMVLLGSGLVGVAGAARRRRRSSTVGSEA